MPATETPTVEVDGEPTTTPAPVDQPPARLPDRLPATRTSSIAAKLAYARELAGSGLLPSAYRRNPSNVLYAVEYGEMLGLSAMAAITGVHVIEGKPSASSGLISGLVRRAGHRLRVTGDDRSATCEIVRKDDPDFTFRSTWTIERARTANLTGKDVWKRYPAAMLKARAITEAARDACEDDLMGLHYTPEELGASVDEDGEPLTVTATRQDQGGQNAGAAADPWSDPDRQFREELAEAYAVRVDAVEAGPGAAAQLRALWEEANGKGLTKVNLGPFRDSVDLHAYIGAAFKRKSEPAQPAAQPEPEPDPATDAHLALQQRARDAATASGIPRTEVGVHFHGWSRAQLGDANGVHLDRAQDDLLQLYIDTLTDTVDAEVIEDAAVRA